MELSETKPEMDRILGVQLFKTLPFFDESFCDAQTRRSVTFDALSDAIVFSVWFQLALVQNDQEKSYISDGM